jgi:sn-glycerol 3-phosphate transport system permease protein
VPIEQLLRGGEMTENTRGISLGGYVEIRNIIQEEMEKAFQGQQNGQQTLAADHGPRQPGAPQLRAAGALGGRGGGAVRRKVIFRGTALPLALLLPQLAVTAVFFPVAGRRRRVTNRCCSRTPGGCGRSSWARNFAEVLEDPAWRTAAGTRRCSRVGGGAGHGAGAGAGRCRRTRPSAAPALPHAADLALRGGAGGGGGAVAVHLPPSIGLVGRALNANGVPWDYRLNGNQAMALVVLAAAWKQVSYNFIFFLAGPPGHPEERAGSGGDRRRAAGAAVLDGGVPAAVADHLLPAGGEPRIRLLRNLRHHPRADRRRAGKATETLIYRAYVEGVQNTNLGSSAAQSVILMLIVVALTMAQFRFVERRVHY